MPLSETAQFLFGASFGLAVVFAALLASTASIHAGESWQSNHRLRAAMLASFAGLSGAVALAGIGYGLVLTVLSSSLSL